MIRALLLAVPLLGLIAGCGQPPYPRGTLDQLYPQPPRPVLQEQETAGGILYWAEMGQGDRPLLFIHGSPGDWKAWARYLDHPALTTFGPRRAVDRPGFGRARQEPVETDLRAQAATLAHLLPEGQRSIVVGHSLGGPLVAWLALDYPERVCGGVMVAGALAPELEAPRWYNRIADAPLLKILLPEALRRSNAEMMPLRSELSRLTPEWRRLQRPLVLLQGLQDELVDPRTADHAESVIPGDWLRVERRSDVGHFLLWTTPQAVINAIQELPC